MYCLIMFFFFKQKTAYEMRISDWSSDVCSSDLLVEGLSFTSAAKGRTVLRQAQHERKKGMALVVLAAMLAPAAAQAQALSCSPPDRIPVPRLERPNRGEPVRKPAITGYLLAMSWSPQHCADRSEERRVGKAWDSTDSTRGSP